MTVTQACGDSQNAISWNEVTPWISDSSGVAHNTLQDNGLTMSDTNVYGSDQATTTWKWRLTSPG